MVNSIGMLADFCENLNNISRELIEMMVKRKLEQFEELRVEPSIKHVCDKVKPQLMQEHHSNPATRQLAITSKHTFNGRREAQPSRFSNFEIVLNVVRTKSQKSCMCACFR
jgi:hypothetical protein